MPNTRIFMWLTLSLSSFLSCAGLAPRPALAQPILGDVTVGIPESSSRSLANALNEASVEPSTGVFRASLRFILPSARGGPQPNLSLGYSSAAGIRHSGVGWGLNLPVIERKNQSGPPSYADPPPEASLDAHKIDRLTYNGEPLVPICRITKGVCLEVPSEPMPSWTSGTGWMYYRLQRDTAYARYFWSPDRRTWRIQMKTGELLELGMPLSGRDDPNIDASLDYEDLQSCSINTNPPGACTIDRRIFRWNIARTFDGQGSPNVIIYLWKRLGQRGLGYLSDLYYTPPGQDRWERAHLQDYAYHIRLDWEKSIAVESYHPPVWRATPDLRLVRVDVASKTFDASGPRELVRRHHLRYERKGNRSYLTAFQIEGKCATPVHEVNQDLPATNCLRLPATELRYSQPEGNTIPKYILQEADSSFPLPQGRKVIPSILLDVNADAVPDLVEPRLAFSADTRVYLNVWPWMKSIAMPITPSSFAFVESSTNPSGPTRTVTGDLVGSGTIGAYNFPNVPITLEEAFTTPQGQLAWRSVPGYTSSVPTIQKLRAVGDVDGDGLVDAVDWDPLSTNNFAQIQTSFTRRTDTTNVPIGATVNSCQGPSASMMKEFDWPDQTRVPFLVDMNGDSLGDLAFIGPDRIKYWPSDGRGNFSACHNASCRCTAGGAEAPPVTMIAPTLNSDNVTSSRVFLQDLDGDGLSDLVTIEADGVHVAFNFEGWIFQAPIFVPGTRIYADWHNLAKNWDELRIGFADMNSNGITDIVFFIRDHVYSLDLHRIINMAPAFAYDAWAPRPGLLIDISNGLGGWTKIDYQSTADMALRARYTGKPWQSPMPQLMHVVGRLTTGSTLPGQRPTYVVYDYDDPAWEGWERRFLGFRKVTRTRLSSFGTGWPTLQREDQFFLPRCDQSTCSPSASSSSPERAASGLLLASKLSNGDGVYHSIVVRNYTVEQLYAGLDGRAVRSAYADQEDTFLFDTANPKQASKGSVNATINFRERPHSTIIDLPTEEYQRVRTSQVLDLYGNLEKRVEHGRIKDSGAPIDDPIISSLTYEPLRSDWKFLTATATTGAFPVRPGIAADYARQRRFVYDPIGRLSEVFIRLEGTLTLDRHHEDTSKTTAPSAPDASKDSDIRILRIGYDTVGNVQSIEGANSRCTVLEYDRYFLQLLVAEKARDSGCNSDLLATTQVWDRGLQASTWSRSPSGSTSAARYDEFGRIKTVYGPDPLSGQPTTSAAVEFEYQVVPNGPAQRIKTVLHEEAGRSSTGWIYLDGTGQLLLSLRQADQAAGDAGAWIASGLPERGAAGEVTGLYESWFYSGAPDNHPLTPPTTPRTTISRDAFGRSLEVRGPGGVILGRRAYRPLRMELTDGIGNLTALTFDGHGRIIEGSRSGGSEKIITTIDYQVSGEVARVIQSHAGGSESITRWLQYDSLGRLMLNAEPNTSVNFAASPSASTTMRAWRYAYNDSGDLVGTSDARGCGKNLHYDQLGRLVAEDYSPCLSSHPEYSSVDLNTGSGAELYHHYDLAEPGQTVDFGVSTSNLLGRLVSTRDQAAHTRYAYDARGRVTGLARRVARPDPGVGDPYSAHWFRKSASYDDANRMIRFSTGAAAAELLDATGKSEFSVTYTARGLIATIGGSYGVLQSSEKRDAVGRLKLRRFGDLAQTTAELTHDSLGRIDTYRLSRSSAPSLWTAGAPGYTPPQPSDLPTTQLVLEDLDFTFDLADNLTGIDDLRSAGAWPAGAKPTSRQFGYDAFDRLNRVDYSRQGSLDPATSFGSPPSSLPSLKLPTRVVHQTFLYEWNGNTNQTTDNLSAFYDRSLGTISNGVAAAGPNQLISAGSQLSATYDPAGNLVNLTIARQGQCTDPHGYCSHRFVYDWDEVGKLVRVRRWDYVTIPSTDPIYPNLPSEAPVREALYRYGAAAQRAIRSTKDADGNLSHTLDVFGTLGLVNTTFNDVTGEYERSASSEIVRLPGRARVLVQPNLPKVGVHDRHVLLEMDDQVNSVTTIIDQETGELVERIAYQAYGAPDSAYRSTRWAGLYSDRRFNGKEDDSDFGLIYFGARYYQPALGRWISPDPLTIHGLASDQNPYAFVAGTPALASDPVGLQPCMGHEDCSGQTGGGGGGGGGSPSDPEDYTKGGGSSGGGGGSTGGGNSRGGQGRVVTAPTYNIKETLTDFVVGAAAFTFGAVQGTAPGGILTDLPFTISEWTDYKRRSPLFQYWQGAGQIVGGIASIPRGLALETGGFVADATGVGAVVGVPANVLGAVTIANGVASIGVGIQNVQAGSAGVLQAGMRGTPPEPISLVDPKDFRTRYIQWLKDTGKNPNLEYGWEVHHKIPQRYASHPEFKDFDFHDPSNLAAVGGSRFRFWSTEMDVHTKISKEWDAFHKAAGGNPTRAQIMDFARQVDHKYGEFYWHNIQ